MADGFDIGDQIWSALAILNTTREQFRAGENLDKLDAVEAAIAAFLTALDSALHPE